MLSDVWMAAWECVIFFGMLNCALLWACVTFECARESTVIARVCSCWCTFGHIKNASFCSAAHGLSPFTRLILENGWRWKGGWWWRGSLEKEEVWLIGRGRNEQKRWCTIWKTITIYVCPGPSLQMDAQVVVMSVLGVWKNKKVWVRCVIPGTYPGFMSCLWPNMICFWFMLSK